MKHQKQYPEPGKENISVCLIITDHTAPNSKYFNIYLCQDHEIENFSYSTNCEAL